MLKRSLIHLIVPCLTDLLFQVTEGVCAEAFVMHEQFFLVVIDVCHAMFNSFLVFFFCLGTSYNLGNLSFQLFFLHIEPSLGVRISKLKSGKKISN